jgi:predicted MFS family arabinose efflux permease
VTQAVVSAASEPPARSIVILASAGFVSAANLRVSDPLLPQIAGDLSVSIGTAAWVVTAFTVAYGLCQIVVGPLGDARGKLAVVVAGCLWAGASSLLAAVTPNLGSLFVARLLAGAGGAAIIPLALAWLGDVIAYERRQSLLARFASGQILGVVSGQAIGGILGEAIGWRGTMVVLGLAHVVTGLLVLAEMRRLRIPLASSSRMRFADAAVQTTRMLKEPWVQVVLATTFLEGFTMFGAFAYVGAELHTRFAIGIGLAGAMLAAFGAGGLSYSLSAPLLMRRFGKARLAVLGSALIGAGYAVLALTPWLWAAPLGVAIIGLGFYMFHNVLQTEATQMAPEARGLAIALFAFVLFTSQAIGVPLAAPVVDRWSAAPVFLIAAAAMPLVALWFSRRLARRLGGGAT